MTIAPFFSAGRHLIDEPVDRLVVLHHDVDAIGVRGGRGGGRGDAGPVRLQRVRLGGGAVPDRHLRAAFQKVPDHAGSQESGPE